MATESIARVDCAIKHTGNGITTSQEESRAMTAVADLLQEMVCEFSTDSLTFHAAPFKSAHRKWWIRLDDMVAGLTIMRICA